MARENSAKKVAKVAKSGRSGRSRSVRQPRQLGFPMLVAGVILVGSLLVFFARSERESTAGERPFLNIATQSGGIQGDHWHAAYGLFVCIDDTFRPPLVDDGPDQTGIHTHADGFIHIHPFSARARGSRATTGVFFEQVGVEVSDDEWTLPGDEVIANGDECSDGTEGEWRVAKWDAVDDPEPEIFGGGFDRIRFRDDGEVFTFFFGPSDAEIPQPGSINDTVDDLAPVLDDDGNVISPDDLDRAFDPATSENDGDAPADDAPADDEAPVDDDAPADDEDAPAEDEDAPAEDDGTE
ncbi:MAG: hypothetical protein AAGA17_12095 [Actinomycetota bacterium]